MLKSAAAKLDITRRDLRTFAVTTAFLTALFSAGIMIVLPAQAHQGLCAAGDLLH